MAQLIQDKGKSLGKSAAGAPPIKPDQLHQRIAERAYRLFLERSQAHGHDLDDWLEAERMILAEVSLKRKGRA